MNPAQSFAVRSLPMPAALRWRLASRASTDAKTDTRGLVVTRMRQGFRMTLNVREPYERTMHLSRLYNPQLTRLFKRVLSAGDTAIDGGANIGYFSLLAASLVGQHGRVHGFEPVPATFAQYVQNIQLNNFTNMIANRKALSAQPGHLDFEVPLEAGTDISLGRLASAVVTGQGTRVVVEACTLDDYSAQAGIGHIKLAKFDLEGHEVAAVQGMHRILSSRQIDYLICELNTPLLAQQGIPNSALRDALAAYGYTAYFIHFTGGFKRPMKVMLVPIAKMPVPDEYGDYLFVAPGQAVPSV